MVDATVAKYLARHAAAETVLAESIPGSFTTALVVPALEERVCFLDDLAPAFTAPDGLCIAVLNAREDDASGCESNRALLEAIRATWTGEHEVSTTPPAWIGRWGAMNLLVLDRSSIGFGFAPGEGVGLARKIGFDLALALWADGRLASDWIHSADADVVLPPDTFAARPSGDAVAMTFPFEHVDSGGSALDAATQLYELSLRHYVEGIRWAGSPYAYLALGSCLAVRAPAYAAVRGFPRRQAGEDFYLLDKLAKLGTIQTPRSSPRLIHARPSQRVPFGTGPGVQRILDAGAGFYPSACFQALARWLELLRLYVDQDDADWLNAQLADQPDLREAVDGLGAPAALHDLHRRHADRRQRHLQVHRWFDGLRTLRFVHSIRDRGFPMQPASVALEDAPYANAKWPRSPGEFLDELRRSDRGASGV